MFPKSLVAYLFQVWRSPIHKNKFKINWRGDVITVIPVPKVSQGVSFFQVIFFKAVILKHILYYNVAFLHTLHSAHMQWKVHANSESYGPWLAEIFFDRLDIVKNKLNLLNEIFRKYRSACEMPHLLSEATVRCCQSCLWVAGKEENKREERWLACEFLLVQLDTSGKRELKLRNCVYQIGLCICLRGFSCLLIVWEGRRSLWMSPSLGRRA